MVYTKAPAGRRQGDCVIHLPPNYGGTLRRTVTEILPERVIEENTVEPESASDTEAAAPLYEDAVSVRTEVEEVVETPEDDAPKTVSAAAPGNPLTGLLGGLNISFEELLLVGLIIMLSRERGNEDLILILAFLLLYK